MQHQAANWLDYTVWKLFQAQHVYMFIYILTSLANETH